MGSMILLLTILDMARFAFFHILLCILYRVTFDYIQSQYV